MLKFPRSSGLRLNFCNTVHNQKNKLASGTRTLWSWGSIQFEPTLVSPEFSLGWRGLGPLFDTDQKDDISLQMTHPRVHDTRNAWKLTWGAARQPTIPFPMSEAASLLFRVLPNVCYAPGQHAAVLGDCCFSVVKNRAYQPYLSFFSSARINLGET